jgi:hypothetical protein
MATHADWLALVELDGLVISEPVLEERFPDGPLPVGKGMHHWFRKQAERWQVVRADPDPARRAKGARDFIDFLLEHVLELPRSNWFKAAEVPDSLRAQLPEFEQELRPDRVLHRGGEPVLLVSIVHPDQGLDRQDRQAGRWKASPTTKLERLLRETGNPLGLVANGEVFRLVHAPAGLNTGHITWTSRVLTEEKATLDAFTSLLGRDLLLPRDANAATLADLCRLSQDRQADVADQLGEQVRNGLERLIWAWDEADRQSGGELLREMTPDQIYEMGLVVMMRLVFLLYAEERDLLPHGEVLYDQGYGLTYLWHRLLRQQHDDPARMNQTHDAWDRFLATCRLVHGGCGHPDLSLLAYGGRLFDPRRFPVLEHQACTVSNRTFGDVLHLLLFARQRKGAEPQRVGYWSIDVEQIGYIYEGLLDHRCARGGDVPVVKLRGAGEAAMPVTDLEKLDRDALVRLVVEETGRKEEAVREALARREPDPRDLDQLRCFPPAVMERVLPFAGVIQCNEIVPPGWRYLTTGTSRRASGAHYTPQFLTERIVRTTLEPLVYRSVDGKPGLLVEPREVKSPRELLALRVCDIAMGSGAFLVQAVRYLADRLVEAWDRALAGAQTGKPGAVLSMPYGDPMTDAEGDRPIDPEKRDEMVLWARRYVVERCIYGVDKNRLAVEMAKLSLWLTTLAKDRPFTFLDHALRCGDSLVGVDRKQLLSWSLDGKGSGSPLLEPLIGKSVNEALELRRQLQQIAVVDAADQERKQALLEKAERAMERVRLAGDLVIAPCFAEEKKAKQEALREELLGRLVAADGEKALRELRRKADRLLGGQRTFHWELELPEVFLDGERGGFDGIVGNPPFVGGRRMRSTLGDGYVGYLEQGFPGSSLNADLCSFFFLRAFGAVGSGGAFGLLATNTIGQGDTRTSGLDRIAAAGGVIYDAVPRMPWPGLAAVNVSVVHVHRGAWHGQRRLDGAAVATISTALDASGLEGKPHALRLNAGKSFQGSVVVGLGFTMPPEEAQAVIAKDPRNKDVLLPYLNGEDLNSRPDQSASRLIINFFDWPLEKAQAYGDVFKIIKEKIYPERMKVRREAHKKYWWHYGDKRPALYRAIAPLERVLVRPEVSRTWAFSFVPNGWVYSHMLIVFPTSRGQSFALLQSTQHRVWSEQHTSSMKTDMRYAPSDCFETFPFPQSPTPAHQSALDAIGETYHEHRRELMLASNEGLTKTYNRFHNPAHKDDGIQRLRDLHVQMDNAVRDAYGWTDLDLEHGWIKTVTVEEKNDKKTGKLRQVEKVDWRFTISERARQEVLRRLLALNHEVHAREVAEGLHDKKKGKAAKKPAAPAQPNDTTAALDDLPLFQAARSRDVAAKPNRGKKKQPVT